MVGCVELGAQIVGGCCGIGPEHIRALSERVLSRVPTGTA
jgi:S-methylmethionine-dependent homocysteine/selenocysteine methylase